MDVIQFISTVLLISVSGALAPGPLFFATVTHGAKSGIKSGLIFSIAHSLVEFILVMFLAVGLLSAANSPIIKFVIGTVGGIVLIVFGALQIQGSLKLKSGETITQQETKKGLLLFGLAFTGLNPFFIIWWLTAGANLILLSIDFASLTGVVLMYFSHISVDFAWLTLVSHFGKIGINILGFRGYRIVLAIFGFVLAYYGLKFFIESINF